MRWFTGRGVGVVALSNTFYAPMSVLTMRLMATLHEHGVVPTAATPAAPAWTAAARRLVELLNNWDDAAAADLFEDNVALDVALSRRCAEAAALIATHGELRITELRPTSAASGDFEVRGSGSAVRIYLELSPSPGAPVQAYTIRR